MGKTALTMVSAANPQETATTFVENSAHNIDTCTAAAAGNARHLE